MSSPQAPMVRKKKKARRTKQLAEWHANQAKKGATTAKAPADKAEKAPAKPAAKK